MWRPSPTLAAWVAMLAFLHGPQLGFGRDCGGELSQETGTISSRNYPQSYPDNEQCRWTITAADNEVIDLRFSRLDLDGVQYSQSRATCPDYVNVYDGDHVQAPLLAKLCRSKTNEELSNTLLRSTGNTMLVEFISDGEGQRTGFLASYWMHECEEFMYGSDYCTNSCNCDRDNSVSCNNTVGTCNCKPGWTSEDCSVDIDECVDPTVEPCPDYQDCVNTVGSFTCQCKEGLQMNTAGQCQASFSCGTSSSCSHTCVDLPGQGQVCYCPNNMKLEGNTSCVDCDNVSFGKECRLSCSSSCNVDNTQSCNTTGGCNCKDGWTSDDCSEDINECELQLDRCQEINKVCVNLVGSYDCVDCNFELSGSSGIIQSPNFPNKYSNGLDCTWTITAAGDDETVTLEIADLIMYRCGDYVSCTTYRSCYCDTLKIYDGKNDSAVSLGEYCSNSIPHLIRSLGNSMHIVYHARRRTSRSERGFNATYVVQDYPSYFMTKTDPSGSISSPSSPAGTNLFSVWTITVAGDKTVAFRMSEINFGSSSCKQSGLVIYDGALGNKVSGKYCGQFSPFNFTSTENTMSIVFYSDGSSSGQGFEGTYITDDCKCYQSTTASCDNGTCVCKEGYTGGDCCGNINECSLELDQCPQYSTCYDTYGSYYCYCNNGTLTTSRDSDACQECISTVTDESGIIQSPDYPSYSKYYFSCSWTIVGQPGKVCFTEGLF